MPGREWERNITEAVAYNARKSEENSKRLNGHDIEIAVIKTRVAIYAAFAGFAGGTIVSVALHFLK